ncbi:MAG: hypothetical protein QOE93_1879 [Actinomycetota bacterium]|jgi:tRNA G18 (ribose-2'-O)-methylase SpoU|nr:hypothetical protein [Actinomycetota bacterium]
MTYRPDDLVLEPVDDPADPRVADYIGLSDAEAQGRADGGVFVAEGSLVIGHLVRSPYRVRSFLVTERGLRTLGPVLAAAGAGVDAGTPLYLATQPMMEAIAGFHFHRGSLASADRGPLRDPDALLAGARRLLVIEGVNDHENLGALFRNAAAFGVDAVLLDPTTCDPLYRRSVRVSAGHVLRLPFARLADWPAGALGAIRAAGLDVVALTPSGSADDLRTLPPHARYALLVGAEGAGLSARALAAADRRVRIPMAPGVDSLNVATAAAIVLHHLAAGPS